MGLTMLLSGAMFFGQPVPFLVCSRLAPSPTTDASVSYYSGYAASLNFMHVSAFMMDFAVSNN